MTESILNGGAPFSDYEEQVSIPQRNKDDIFYSTLLTEDDVSDPVELYKKARLQQEETGYSLLVEEARAQWKQEQDFITRETVNSIIEDPQLDKEFKKATLQNYVNTSTISNDIKDKVIQQLTSNYLLENGLDQNDQAIGDVQLVVDKLKYDQNKARLIANLKVNGKNTAEVTPDDAANKILTVAKKLEMGMDLEDPAAAYSTEAELIFAWDMALGKGPPWLQNMLELLGQKIANPALGGLGLSITKEVLSRIFPSQALLTLGIESGYNTKTWTEARKDIEEKNKTAWTQQWADIAEESLTALGYPPELLQQTLLGRVFNSLGEFFNWAGTTLNPNDPQAVIVPLEILTVIGLAKVKLPTRKKESNIPPTASEKSSSQRATAADAIREANRKSAEEYNQKTTKVKGSEKVSVNPDSPIVTMTQSNKKAGSKLVDSIIQDETGQLGEVSGLTRPQLIHYLTDPNSNIVKTTEFGFNTDISRVTQMELTAARERELLIRNPDLADTPLVDNLIDQIVITLDGIVPEVPMIISNTFQTFVRTPTGLRISLPFRKSPVENYKVHEIVPAYNQLLESIKANFVDAEGAVKPGEVLIQELDNLNNVVNEFTPGTMPDYLSGPKVVNKPTGRSNGAHATTKWKNKEQRILDEIIVDETALTKSFENKPWTTPRVPGVTPLPENIFTTPQDWIDFVTQHEIAHYYNPEFPGEAKAAYENRINAIALDKINNPSVPVSINEFVITWRPDGNVYDSMFNSFGHTPSDRFPTDSLTDRTQRTLYDTEVTNSSTGLINQLFTYGRYNKATEKRIYQDSLTKNSYFKQQEKQLHNAIKKELNKLQQNQLARLLEYQDSRGKDQLTVNEITDVLGYSPDYKDVLKLQTALTTYRIFENSKYQADNITYTNILVEAGFDKAFYVKSQRLNIDGTEAASYVVTVKESFPMVAGDPLAFTETGEALRLEIWDTPTNKPILWSPEVGPVKTHYVIGENKMPNQQVYRLGTNYVDEITGFIYQYATFGTLKPQPLPNDVLPRRPGHVPKMREETYTILEIPLKVRINGKEIDFTTGKFANLGNKRILDVTGKLVSKSESLLRAEIIQSMMPFAKVRAMRTSKAKAYSWSKKNIFDNPDSLFIINKAKELTIKDVADFRIREIQSVQGQRFRNEGLDFEVRSDPYETAVRTGTTIGQTAFGQIGINQLKNEWSKTYKPDPRVKIQDNPVSSQPLNNLSLESQVEAKSNFPKEVSQIQDVPGFEEFGKQVRADWWLIYNKEMGKAAIDTKIAVNSIRKMADSVGNLTENKKFTAWMAKGARSIQRSPQESTGVLLKTVTTVQIMLNITKQLPLQAIAPFSGILTVSKNPVDFFRNVHYAYSLMTRRFIQSRQFASGKLDLERMHDYMFEQENILVSQEFTGGLNLTGKDLDLILQASRESGFSLVSDHLFTKGIGLNSISKLGKGKNAYNKIVETLTEYGFELGEVISRDGHTIVALRNWITANPGKNWRTQANLSQIMFDAYRLSGSMTTTTSMAWQSSITLRALGQFTSFGIRMNEAAINPNATPFGKKDRIKNIAYNFALYGTAAFAIQTFVIDMLEKAEEGALYNFAQLLKKVSVFYILGNKVGDYLFEKEGERDSESVFGDVFGLYANKDSMLGPYSKISAFMLGILNDDVDTRNVGATIAFVKKVWGVGEEITEMWIRNPEAFKEERVLKSLIAMSEFLPPIKAGINLTQQLEAQNIVATKTGHNYGLDYTTSELVFKNLWGVPTLKNKSLWEVGTSDRERQASLKAHAKRFMQIIARKADGTAPDYFEVSRALIEYKLILDNKGFISTSIEHQAFVEEVMSLMGKQKTPIAEKFIRKYMDRVLIGGEMTDTEIRDARKAIDMSNIEDEYKQNYHDMINSIVKNQTLEDPEPKVTIGQPTIIRGN